MAQVDDINTPSAIPLSQLKPPFYTFIRFPTTIRPQTRALFNVPKNRFSCPYSQRLTSTVQKTSGATKLTMGGYVYEKSKQLESRIAERNIDTSAAYLKHLLHDDTSILDVGCGPGSITASFKHCCPDGNIVGVDQNKDVLEVASGKYPDIQFREGNMELLPFEDDTFDIVHSHQVIQYISNPVGGITEMKRVCKPGGVVAIRAADSAGSIWYPPNRAFEMISKLYTEGFKYSSGDVLVARKLIELCSEVGFRDIKLSSSNKTFSGKKDMEMVYTHWMAECGNGCLGKIWREHGLMSDEELQVIKDGLAAFKSATGALLINPNMEIICVK